MNRRAHSLRRRARSVVAVAVPLVVLLFASSIAEAQNPSGRIYVRRIEFEGVTNINDEVLRREMLQLEGTYLNTVALDESLRRLARLPFVANARAQLDPVPGSPDVVDVVVTVMQTPARRYGGGGGYSPSDLGSLHAYFVNENLFGTGRRFAFTMEGGELRDDAQISFTDPYARPIGISRTLRVSARNVNQPAANASRFDAEIDTASVEYGYATGRPLERKLAPKQPLSPFQTELGETNQHVRFGLGASRVSLAAGADASDQLLDWITSNGDTSVGSDGAAATDFTELNLRFEWRYDTRDRATLTTTGLEQIVSLQTAIPGGDVQYYIAQYEAAKYWRVGERWTASLQGRVGFGRAYGGDTSALPPYLNFFAGGVDSVRGYRANTLGPIDSLGRPYGGNLLVTGQLELLTPWPERWSDRVKVGFFFDVGNVFSTEDVTFADASGQVIDHGFDVGEFRRSAGLTAHVLLPVGELELSYGFALGADDDNPSLFSRDQLEHFQLGIQVDF